MRRYISFVLLFFFSVQFAFSQDNQAGSDSSGKTSLPTGYGGVTLGMSLDSAKDALKKNSDFGYRGEKDVRLTPGDEKTLIECNPQKTMANPFLERCYFQFNDDTLYIITIKINRERMDYFSMFDTLTKKYGNPNSLNPDSATWADDTVTMTLEKPLSIKYIDNNTFNDLEDKAQTQKNGTEKSRDLFLKDF